MNDYQRLDAVVKLAEKKEEAASQEVKNVSVQLAQEETRLQDLNNYHQEYQKKIYDLQNKRTSVNDIQTYYAFMHQLNNVVAAQQQQIKLVTQQLDHIKTHWMKCRVSLKGIVKLREKRKFQHQAHLDKQEQKALDDLVTTIFNRKQ